MHDGISTRPAPDAARCHPGRQALPRDRGPVRSFPTLPGLVALVALAGATAPPAPPGTTAGPEAPASAAQSERAARVAWLAAHAVPLRTLDPADDDSDLMPLRDLIGEARVVQLGEASHGDGATFDAKARLIRFLHREMGFDAIAWEAGIFDMQAVDEALSDPSIPVAEAGSLGLYSLWWRSREVERTLQYVRDSRSGPRPIRLVGFDSRVSTAEGREERFPATVFELFDRLDPTLISATEREAFTFMSSGLVPADYYRDPGPRDYDRTLPPRLLDTLRDRRDELLALGPAEHLDWVEQCLRSMMAMDRALEGSDGMRSAPDGYSRDAAMAENLLWWLNGPLAGRKVIVWAQDFHVQEGFLHPEAQSPDRPWAGPTGRFLADALGDDLYTVASISFDGAYGYVDNDPVPLPHWESDSIEALMADAGLDNAWVDLHTEGADWLREPIPAGVMMYDLQQTGSWPGLYDAFLFLRTQRPATAIDATDR